MYFVGLKFLNDSIILDEGMMNIEAGVTLSENILFLRGLNFISFGFNDVLRLGQFPSVLYSVWYCLYLFFSSESKLSSNFFFFFFPFFVSKF
jgi:hypothetical protein